MIRVGNLAVKPGQDEQDALTLALKRLRLPREAVTRFRVAKKSVDARDKGRIRIVYALDLQVQGDEGQLLRRFAKQQVSRTPDSAPMLIPRIGKKARVAVIGLGPGAAELMVPAVKAELARCTDVLGYETYVRMAGPFRDDQVQHCTDNREEMQRARHAFELAAQGRSVVVVSSGDPGVFAMAAAVIEALHESSEPAWHQVDLEILPGVSASLATAAQAGAPLGHDFCVMSLSDNLKPWAIIEKRLDLASQADLALAFYNPISRSRPWQLGRALEIVALHRTPQTPVVLGRDIGRPGQTLRVTTLGQLTPEQVDMRTMVLIGSSTTCVFPRAGGGEWVYTPRWYGDKPNS